MADTNSIPSRGVRSLGDMSGKVALITGGGTGIGLMMAKGFASCGAKVYIAGRRLEVLQNTASTTEVQGTGTIEPLQLDVTSKESIQKAVDLITQKDGKLNVLVNNAGVVGPGTPFILDNKAQSTADYGRSLFESQSSDEWAELTKINVAPLFFVTMAFLGLLEASTKDSDGHWASVINTTSGVVRGNIHQGVWAYTCLKSATSHLSRLLAVDFGLKGIPVRVNAIAPGFFMSELSESEEKLNELAKSKYAGLQVNPMKRIGTTGEMAALAVYFASPASGYTNGQEITVDGGLTIVNP